MAYLLDTNHCIYMMNGLEKSSEFRSEEESQVIKAVNSLDDYEALYMAEVTLGELYYGASLSEREEHNIKKIEVLTNLIRLLKLKDETWKMFGKTKASLRREGKKMSDFDLLIACLAKTNNCIIVTNDKGFENLPKGFDRLSWAGVNA